MDRKPNNPYQYITAVLTSEMFFGRTHTLRQIYSAIDSQQSISLVGSQGVGKSSILNCMLLPAIQKRFEFDFSHHIFIYFNMEECSRGSCQDFFQYVNERIFDEVSKVMEDLELELEPEGEQEDFADLLNEIKKRKFHLVLVMDAFDNIARNENFDADFFSFLRSQCLKVSYVTASAVELRKVCHQQIQDSPFWNIFSPCQVGALTSEEAYQLVTEPAARVGLPFTEDEARWLTTYAGHHPLFLHFACRILFDEKCAPNVTAINLGSQEHKIYEHLLGYFEDVWNHLEQHQQDKLKQEMQQKFAIPSYIPELSSSKLFQAFIRARYHLRIFELTVEELEIALDQLDEARELGKSNLYLLTLVSRRVTSDASIAQKGAAIRDVLKEAHERMRGSGVRTDSGFDWRLYNILYYRYFKHHLKHKLISGRLGFNSTRQYFRDKKKALEVLLNELLEMEEDINK